ncbi:DNA-binding helix turn-helix protein [Medicago truncatula]|uniref:DNA-binding helix turn-helix protein n=1 Tax=Medicago truncatula TaxID=3880 RepID=A0A072U695_MEDTR|nr:DNA-binding helix turn-helix protein [Medicago truncatula]
MDKKLTQAQLAQIINEKPQVIKEYESGKAIPNQMIIGKLESWREHLVPKSLGRNEKVDLMVVALNLAKLGD